MLGTAMAVGFSKPSKATLAGNKSVVSNYQLLPTDAHRCIAKRPVFLEFPVNEQLSMSNHNILQTRINHLDSISQQHRMIGATP